MLCFIRTNLAAQDTIVGIYNSGAMQIEVNTDGTFMVLDSYLSGFSMGFRFYGKWHRINDSIVIAKCDTIVTSNIEHDYEKFSEMHFMLLTRDSYEILRCYIHFFDTSPPYYYSDYSRSCYLYSDNKLRRDLAFVNTDYFPNGKIHEITEFNYENNKKQGIYMRYSPNGQLEKYELWYDGKAKIEWSFLHKNKVNRKKNIHFYPDRKRKKNTKIHILENHVDIKHFSDGKIQEISTYKNALKDGVSLNYNPSGRLEKYSVWHKGQLKGEQTVDNSIIYSK